MEITLIICSTFLLVLVAFWIMSEKKMKAVNKQLILLLQILPISTIIKAIKNSKSVDTSKEE